MKVLLRYQVPYYFKVGRNHEIVLYATRSRSGVALEITDISDTPSSKKRRKKK